MYIKNFTRSLTVIVLLEMTLCCLLDACKTDVLKSWDLGFYI